MKKRVSIDPMTLIAILSALWQFAQVVWPYVQKWWQKRHGTPEPPMPTDMVIEADNPKELASKVKHACRNEARKRLLKAPFYLFMAHITTRFADQLWDQFNPEQKAATFASDERCEWSEGDESHALRMLR